ncbi:MAG TPA: hypothetical protein VFL80_02720 [Thermoanaerobaculia bacterium]|nr:hypothetical protein [Thermoanaerobaculia bacterium]
MKPAATTGLALVLAVAGAIAFFWIPGMGIMFSITAAIVGIAALLQVLPSARRSHPLMFAATCFGAGLAMIGVPLTRFIDVRLGAVMLMVGCAIAVLAASAAGITDVPRERSHAMHGAAVAGFWFGVTFGTIGLFTLVFIPSLGLLFVLLGSGVALVSRVVSRMSEAGPFVPPSGAPPAA